MKDGQNYCDSSRLMIGMGDLSMALFILFLHLGGFGEYGLQVCYTHTRTHGMLKVTACCI